MTMFENLLLEFGRRLGVENLAPAGGGGADLTIEKIGRLQLEESGERFFATLARPIPPHAGETARKLLDLSHWRENHPWTIHPGMKGGEWLTLTAEIPLAEADVPTLERMIGYLAKLLDAAAEG